MFNTVARFDIAPQTIFLARHPTRATIAQLELLLRGFQQQLICPTCKNGRSKRTPEAFGAKGGASVRIPALTGSVLGCNPGTTNCWKSWDANIMPNRPRNRPNLRQAGFPNINVDLMFGLPGQTGAQWEATLQKTIQLRPEHISAYCLTYEEDTESLSCATPG